MQSNIILYTTEDGKTAVDVKLDNETVWLTQKQMSELFEKDVRTINEHIKNVYKDRELQEIPTIRNFRIVQTEGKRDVIRDVVHYNLDVIISVGYRVKSKRGTQFRIWANSVLKEYLIKGYAVNQKRLEELHKTIKLLENTITYQQIELDQAKELVKVISDFSYGLSLLDDYDHQSVEISDITKGECYQLKYKEVRKLVDEMTKEFNTGLFGHEKDEGFKGALGNIYQTFGGEELYPSIEEKAANLLYFIVKDHAFSDGNKRIAAATFLYFLDKNRLLYKTDGSKRIPDNTLVAVTLMIAESRPQEKDIIVKIVVNLINKRN